MREYKGIERRRYIRLKSVFPVEFKLLSQDGEQELSDFIQGFTADISTGGILLRVNNPRPEVISMMKREGMKLFLDINMPLHGRPIEAVSNVAWVKVIKEDKRNVCMVGLSFEEINSRDKRRLLGYSTSLYRAPKLTALALLLMLTMLGVERSDEIILRRENSILIERLTDVLQRKSTVTEWLDKAGRERNELLTKIEKQDGDIAKIREEKETLLSKEKELRLSVEDLDALKTELDKGRNVQNALESQLVRLSLDRKGLQDNLDKITLREKMRLKELERIERARLRLEEATLENMYNWLKVHRNKKTGLVASYEGDSALKNSAFSYDQSLMAQVSLLQNDIEDARLILDFFKYRAPKIKGGFANAYSAANGAITEPIVHCGPNIWLGIAFMQYMEKTGSAGYLDVAKEIGNWVIKIQNEDPGGGIRGGPDVTWFSTEHNLDAYTFFTMLAQKTGSKKYKNAADESLNWIKKNAYTGKSGRINRGRGDSTIATDTFAWAIASIGPGILLDNKMDPDAIMKFAEEHCKVTVNFERPNGDIVKVTGFDFAKHRHLGRGGVVSSEWTAQMIVSLGMMSDFYLGLGDIEKARYYQEKHDFYINELEKLVISSPSPFGQGAGCLPYATQDNVDTGHGWRTPRGKDTGSVSGTAYGIFAIKGYNPLKLASSKKGTDLFLEK